MYTYIIDILNIIIALSTAISGTVFWKITSDKLDNCFGEPYLYVCVVTFCSWIILLITIINLFLIHKYEKYKYKIYIVVYLLVLIWTFIVAFKPHNLTNCIKPINTFVFGYVVYVAILALIYMIAFIVKLLSIISKKEELKNQI